MLSVAMVMKCPQMAVCLLPQESESTVEITVSVGFNTNPDF
jgi:hypothetical protein